MIWRCWVRITRAAELKSEAMHARANERRQAAGAHR